MKNIRYILERLLAYLSLWVFRLFIFFVIITAVVVSIGREMAPLLAQNKVHLEAHMSAASGQIIQMRSVEARWEGLIPELKATGLQVGDNITIENALLRVDLFRSALNRFLVFDALIVSDAKVRVVMDANEVSTFSAQNNEDDKKVINIKTALSFLFGSANIRFQNVEILLQRSFDNTLVIHVPNLDVGNYRNNHWLKGSIFVPDAKSPIKLVASFKGSVLKLLSGEGEAYLNFGDGSKIRRVVAFLINQEILPVEFDESGNFLGQIWLEWSDNKLLWSSTVDIKSLRIIPLDFDVDYKGVLSGSFLIDSGRSGNSPFQITAYAPQGAFKVNQKSYHVPSWGLRYRLSQKLFEGEPELALYIPELELAELDRFEDLIPQETLKKTLATLQPRGVVNNFWLKVPAKKGSFFKPLVQANLEGVSVAAWEAAPSLAQVNGYVEATLHRGFVELQSDQGFSMHFPGIYEQSMDYHSAQGRVSWYVDALRDYVYVGSHGIDLAGVDGDAKAAFWVCVPPARLNKASEMYLSVGLKNTKSEYRNKYLPTTLPDQLKQWLDNSIVEGFIPDNGFIYRGSLRKDEAHEKSILYYANIRGADLNFDPDWPVLRNIDAFLLVDNDQVTAKVETAELDQLKIDSADVAVTDGNFLSIQGGVKGQGDSALDLLRATPIRDAVGTAFDQWRLQGLIEGRVSLGIPLSGSAEQEFQEVAIKLNKNRLQLKDINLSIGRLSGDLHYSNALGLTASQLHARLWEKDLSLSIEPLVDKDGLPDIQLKLQGDVSIDYLAQWSGLPVLKFIEGDVSVIGELNVPLDNASQAQSARLSFRSDMNGTVIDLPEPFSKAKDTKRLMQLDIALKEKERIYNFSYADQLRGLISVYENSPAVGQIVINSGSAEELTLPASGLEVSAQLGFAVVEEWLDVVERYNQYQSEISIETDPSAAGEASGLPQFYLSFDRLQLDELLFDKSALSINYQPVDTDHPDAYWNIDFFHVAGNGQFHYFDDPARLPDLAFERLDLDVWEESRLSQIEVPPDIESPSASASKDPLAEVVPQNLYPLNFDANNVVLDGANIGRWKFTVKPELWGASLNNFSARMPGLSIGGIAGNDASVLWRFENEEMETQVSSLIQISGSEGMDRLFGVEQIFEAEKTKVQGSLGWEGSPANLQFNKLVGEVSVESKKGRFLNSNPTTDMMRVINIFNFSTWARRLKLDFSDLYKKGISYDRVDGYVQLDHGKLIFDKPLVMESPSSRFAIQGVADSASNTIDADLTVTLPVSSNAPWIAAVAGGLPAAVGVWAVSKVFEKQIDKFASLSYKVSGELDQPKIEFQTASESKSNKQKPSASDDKLPAEAMP